MQFIPTRIFNAWMYNCYFDMSDNNHFTTIYFRQFIRNDRSNINN